MADLNLDLDYFNHPQTKRLIGRLGRGSEVMPLRLWCYCGKFHCADGRLAGYSEQEIESIAEWWGKRGEAIAAMVAVGFVDKEADGTYVMHNWGKRQGHLHAIQLHVRMMAERRWAKRSNASSIADSNADSNAPSIRPSVRPPRGGGGAELLAEYKRRNGK
jgi:hypothetical protein